MAKQTEIEERREKIRRLLVRAISPTEIGRILEITRDTVYRDLDAISEAEDVDIKALTANAIGKGILRANKERVRYYWNLYEKTVDPKVKVSCLAGLRAEDDHVIKTCQSLGIVYKEPDVLEHRAGSAKATERLKANCGILTRYGLGIGGEGEV